jgi:hypothetical protein
MRTTLQWLGQSRIFWESVLDSLANYLEPAAESGPGSKK